MQMCASCPVCFSFPYQHAPWELQDSLREAQSDTLLAMMHDTRHITHLLVTANKPDAATNIGGAAG